jgi:hypothetical protein
MKRRTFLTSLFAAPVVASVSDAWWVFGKGVAVEMTGTWAAVAENVGPSQTRVYLLNLQKFIEEMRRRPYVEHADNWPKASR